MTCTNPQTIYIRHSHPIDFQQWEEHEQHHYNKAKLSWKKGYIEIKVPCGKCLGCKLDHANEWATRCTIEAKNWTTNCMITLTYNNPNLPRTITGKPTLKKEDVQKFIKRLRKLKKGIEKWKNPKTGKTEKPIRYFYCGEYGPTTGRPHYHMILFNWKPTDLEFYKLNKHGDTIYKSKELQKIWGKGFVTIEDMNYNTACYVARYCTKKAGLAPKIKIASKQCKIDEKGIHTVYLKNKNKPIETYINMSTGVGIGLKYWLENIDFLKKWQYIELKINNEIKRKPLPRYFKKKWNNEDWESYENAKYKNFIQSENNKNQILKLDNYSDKYTKEEKWQMHLKKVEEKLLNRTSRAGLLSRNGVDETNEVPAHPFTSAYYIDEVPKRNQSKKYTDSEQRWKRIQTRWRAQELAKDNFDNLCTQI